MAICKHCREATCKCENPDRKKVCTVCGHEKKLSEMASTGVKGAPAHKRRSYCKTCKHKKNPASRFRRKLDRLRASAKRRGLVCTLTSADVRRLLSSPCTYCGKDDDPSIDRRDNGAGYLPENCVPACFRCNSLRGGMPYEAWELLVPGIQEAQRAGFFGMWRGHSFPHR